MQEDFTARIVTDDVFIEKDSKLQRVLPVRIVGEIPGMTPVPGPKGPDGKSAYEVAVDNGFVGNEADWLASLKGEQGEPGRKGDDGEQGLSAYRVAVANGFEGSETEWLASLKPSDGEDGKSAYQLAVEQGFEGSETYWLESLKGEPGINATYYNADGIVTSPKVFSTKIQVTGAGGVFTVNYAHVGFSTIDAVQLTGIASENTLAGRRLVDCKLNGVTLTGLTGDLMSASSAGLLAAMTMVEADEGGIYITVFGS